MDEVDLNYAEVWEFGVPTNMEPALQPQVALQRTVYLKMVRVWYRLIGEISQA